MCNNWYIYRHLRANIWAVVELVTHGRGITHLKTSTVISDKVGCCFTTAKKHRTTTKSCLPGIKRGFQGKLVNELNRLFPDEDCLRKVCLL